MDKELRDYLRDNEQVRWQGRPEPFPLLEGSSKAKILRTWIVTGVIVCALLVWYFGYAEKNAGFLGLMLIIAALIMISPFTERRNLLGQNLLDHQSARDPAHPGQVFLLYESGRNR